jgi:predicted permease
MGDFPEPNRDLCVKLHDRGMQERDNPMIQSFAHDLAYAIKTLRRAPGFTLIAVATIALGISTNAAVFSLLNALFLQSLDAANPGELVRIYTSQSHPPRHDGDRFGSSSYADYVDLRHSTALAGVAAVTPVSAVVQLNGTASPFPARIVSEDYFAVLNRPLLLGGWHPDDGSPGSTELEVIVSHSFWSSTLGRDLSVIGRPLVVNGRSVRVAGVTSPSFKGVEPARVDLYFPFRSAIELTGRPGFLTDRGERSVRLLGRLASGVTPQSAEAALDGIMRALGDRFPATNAGRSVSVRAANSILPLELMGPGIAPTAGLIFGASLVMLAISGVNVAAVLMARTVRRRRELAVRQSIGAGSLRLVGQLLTESVVLALSAGVVALGLVSLLPWFASWLGVPESVRPTVDWMVLGYGAAVAVSFGVLFGLAPAVAGMRLDVVESLRGGEVERPARARTQRALVCSQLALSMLLLVVGGALLENLHRQQRIDPGFAVEQLVVAIFEDPTGVTNEERNRAFTQLVVPRLRGYPGVVSVSVASMAPLNSDGASSTIHIPGYAKQPDEDMQIQMMTAGPDFFRTLRIPMHRGRELAWDDHDTAPRVVVNDAMARRYWGTRDPIGTVVRLGGAAGVPAEVIGVSADARFRSLAEEPRPMYVIQRSSGGGQSVLIRTRDHAEAFLLPFRGLLSRSDVALTLVQLQTMEEILRISLVVTRVVSDTVMTVGMLATLVAGVGLYGVVSYVMGGRTREFGVRLALGASPSSLARLVLGDGMRLALIGGAAGMVMGWGALRLISGMLIGAWNSGPAAVVAGVVLSVVALIACAIPAVRATVTAPADTLRSD